MAVDGTLPPSAVGRCFTAQCVCRWDRSVALFTRLVHRSSPSLPWRTAWPGRALAGAKWPAIIAATGCAADSRTAGEREQGSRRLPGRGTIRQQRPDALSPPIQWHNGGGLETARLCRRVAEPADTWACWDNRVGLRTPRPVPARRAVKSRTVRHDPVTLCQRAGPPSARGPPSPAASPASIGAPGDADGSDSIQDRSTLTHLPRGAGPPEAAAAAAVGPRAAHGRCDKFIIACQRAQAGRALLCTPARGPTGPAPSGSSGQSQSQPPNQSV